MWVRTPPGRAVSARGRPAVDRERAAGARTGSAGGLEFAAMATPGSGRKRAPIKDRFSAEDEALSSIAREAEARLAAKRAARAEARDIRMRELERQQKEFRQVSPSRKWGQIHQWMEDSQMATMSHRLGGRRSRVPRDNSASLRTVSNYRDYQVGPSPRSYTALQEK
ncbi:leucine-rich repeat flightless-interacting protein 2 isoform X1 [Arapaima gigas]